MVDAAMTEFGYHQDIRFRRPRTAYHDPAANYLQTGIAIDAHRRENGAMLVYPGSHRLGELDLGEGRVMDRPLDDEDQPGYEVVDDVLQAEADPHAERTGNEGDLRRIDAERGQREYGAGDHSRT